MLQTVISQTGIEDAGLVAELINEFIESGELLLVEIDAAYATQNSNVIASKLHELKGMAGNLGFVAVSRCAESLERSQERDVPGEIRCQLEELRSEFNQLRATWTKSEMC